MTHKWIRLVFDKNIDCLRCHQIKRSRLLFPFKRWFFCQLFLLSPRNGWLCKTIFSLSIWTILQNYYPTFSLDNCKNTKKPCFLVAHVYICLRVGVLLSQHLITVVHLFISAVLFMLQLWTFSIRHGMFVQHGRGRQTFDWRVMFSGDIRRSGPRNAFRDL